MENWLWIGGALLLGLAIGGVVTALIMRRRRGDEETVRGLRREMDAYKREVTEHFVRTADLVNDLTHSYKAVYDHLESGAYRLVGEERLHAELENVKAEPVMLEYIGRRERRPPGPAKGDLPAERDRREAEREMRAGALDRPATEGPSLAATTPERPEPAPLAAERPPEKLDDAPAAPPRPGTPPSETALAATAPVPEGPLDASRVAAVGVDDDRVNEEGTMSDEERERERDRQL